MTGPRANVQVDPLRPKPLPNHWVMGSVIGVAVDSQDDVWMLHRPATLKDNQKGAALNPPIGECCVPAGMLGRFSA